jgi:hypothetical protein
MPAFDAADEERVARMPSFAYCMECSGGLNSNALLVFVVSTNRFFLEHSLHPEPV